MKIVVTGPESTGKSSLSNSLAKHYKIDFVPEYARGYLTKKGGSYGELDLLKIAEGQIALEDHYKQKGRDLVICDTSLEVIRVWAEWKYGRCDPYILDQARIRVPDLFFLLKPDFPWQDDPLRENPHDRDKLFTHYKNILSEYGTEVIEIGGDNKARLKSAIDSVESLRSI